MNKKRVLIIIIALLLFAGFFAMTQDLRTDLSPSGAALPSWVRPIRWFRSNQGGMAVEEVSTKFIALRYDYALSVEFVRKDLLPEKVLPFYRDEYFIEQRILYEYGEIARTQWIFRDRRGRTRVNCVFMDTNEEQEDSADDMFEEDHDYLLAEASIQIDEEQANEEEVQEDDGTWTGPNLLTGFIEIFDENTYLVSEYLFYENNSVNRLDYTFRNGYLISAAVYSREGNNGDEYIRDYTDSFRYNRSNFLRSVERIFHRERQIPLAGEPLLVSFPRRLADAVSERRIVREMLNSYPEFFGEVHVERNNRIVYITDDRGRILTQTLYDEEDNIVWVINNTWRGDRIVSTVKKEDDIEFLAEFEYDSAGDRVIERNFKNGVLERLVRTEGSREIEELYYNNVAVLQAIWEDGRKISETRIINR